MCNGIHFWKLLLNAGFHVSVSNWEVMLTGSSYLFVVGWSTSTNQYFWHKESLWNQKLSLISSRSSLFINAEGQWSRFVCPTYAYFQSQICCKCKLINLLTVLFCQFICCAAHLCYAHVDITDLHSCPHLYFNSLSGEWVGWNWFSISLFWVRPVRPISQE